MTVLVRRLCWCIGVGAGFLALALLWLPVSSSVSMSFSGPSRTVTHYGLLAWMDESVDHHPRRFPAADWNGLTIELPVLQPGEEFWDHHGEFGDDMVVVAMQPRLSAVHGLPLIVTLMATLVLLWLTVVKPIRQFRRSMLSVRSAPERAQELSLV